MFSLAPFIDPKLFPVDSVRAGNGMPARQKKDRQKMAQVAQDFETLFLNMMMKSMRKTVVKSDLFSGGRGGEVFQELLDMTFSESAARSGRGFGIAKLLVDRYSRNAKPDGAGVNGGGIDGQRSVRADTRG